MGGRLALHVAMLAPEAISGVLLISTHPGIHDPRKISERNQWERMWAETFRHFPLEQALERWNQQDVFQGTAPKADWRPLPVDSILQSLTNWSTTRHRFDWAQIRKSKKTRWVVGARDPRYVQLMEELWDGGRAEVRPVTVLPDSGHRVLSDAPISLAQTLVRFIVSERQRGGDL
jgi:pimeloyl-ACP methyl ester carboxylesterase